MPAGNRQMTFPSILSRKNGKMRTSPNSVRSRAFQRTTSILISNSPQSVISPQNPSALSNCAVQSIGLLKEHVPVHRIKKPHVITLHKPWNSEHKLDDTLSRPNPKRTPFFLNQRFSSSTPYKIQCHQKAHNLHSSKLGLPPPQKLPTLRANPILSNTLNPTHRIQEHGNPRHDFFPREAN